MSPEGLTQEERDIVDAINDTPFIVTQITPLVRVSTAVIASRHIHYPYWQVETYIFSKDERQRTVQICHGTQIKSHEAEPFNHPKLWMKAIRAHCVAVIGLRRKLIS